MRTILVVPVVALLIACGAATATASPSGRDAVVLQVDPRTSVAVVAVVPGLASTTENAAEPRAGVSITKLYLVDYALRHGDHSDSDRAAAQRAIQLSDDAAADLLDAEYPEAIAAIAAEFGLTATRRGSFWGDSVTSARDVAEFLAAKERTDSASPMLAWMATAAPVAADGTVQNWGTSHLPATVGTKWGWTDDHTSEVASASFGPGFAAAAFTYGTAEDQNADLAGLTGR